MTSALDRTSRRAGGVSRPVWRSYRGTHVPRSPVIAWFSFLAILCFPLSVSAQEAKKASKGYPPNLPDAKVEVYKTAGDAKLNLYIFNPEGHKASDKRPAAVFFFGGGWTNGSPGQFQEHCRYLASRGMVAITADYRVASRQQVKAVACVADAKSAVRFVRKEAARLGIDPNRIVAGGGSAGGHIAACTGTIQGFDETTEDAAISSVPSALALFNPALALAPLEGVENATPAKQKDRPNMAERMGTDPRNLSPVHHVKKGAPPTIIFHGKADTTVPYASAEAFAKAMTAAGNKCVLVGYEGQGHGFFNFDRGPEYYGKTIKSLDEFLVGLGYLSAPAATKP